MNKKNILKKYGMMVLAVYALAAVLFLVLANHHIRYTPEQSCVIAENPEKDLGELVDGTSIVQTLSDTQKYLSGVEAYFLTYGRENQGSVRVEILDLSDESVAASSTCEVKSFGNGEWQSFELDHPVDVTQLKGQPGIRFVFENGTESNAVTMTTQAVSETDQELWVNGERQDGKADDIRERAGNNGTQAACNHQKTFEDVEPGFPIPRNTHGDHKHAQYGSDENLGDLHEAGVDHEHCRIHGENIRHDECANGTFGGLPSGL